MKRVFFLSLVLSALSACVSNGDEQRVRWDDISATHEVARVSDIKSLISPGFY